MKDVGVCECLWDLLKFYVAGGESGFVRGENQIEVREQTNGQTVRKTVHSRYQDLKGSIFLISQTQCRKETKNGLSKKQCGLGR